MASDRNGQPPGLDHEAFPFASRWIRLDAGAVHYVDEGQGEPVLFVHGTPTWSFLWRHLIQGLRDRYRCIAPDHLGFGLSDKPPDFSYLPRDQADNLGALVDRLRLDAVTLVVHDYGGPIGLAWALAHPERVRRLVVFNSWLWPFAGDPAVRGAGLFFASPMGRWLYQRWNFSPRVMMRLAWGRHRPLAPEVHRHYVAVLPTPAARLGTWVLARELTTGSAWLDALWVRRERVADIPAMIVWGMRDPALKAPHLARWERLLRRAQRVRLTNVGHFVPDEAGPEVAPMLARFLSAR